MQTLRRPKIILKGNIHIHPLKKSAFKKLHKTQTFLIYFCICSSNYKEIYFIEIWKM